MARLKKATSGHLLKHPASGHLIKGCVGGCRCMEGVTCTHCGAECTPDPIYVTFVSVSGCTACMAHPSLGLSEKVNSLTLTGPYTAEQTANPCVWEVIPDVADAQITVEHFTTMNDCTGSSNVQQYQIKIQVIRTANDWQVYVIADQVVGDPELFNDTQAESANDECEVFPNFANDIGSGDCSYNEGVAASGHWAHGGTVTLDCEDGI